MPVRIDVNEAGIERVRTLTQGLLLTDRDKAGPLRKELQKTHIKQVNKAFSTQGVSVQGGPWKGWSAPYAAWRARNPSLGKKMLVLTGTMKERFTKATHGAFVSNFVKPFTFQFGAVDDVAFKHQNAVDRLPKRSVIDKTSKQLKEFRATLESYWIKRIEQVLRNV